MSFRELINCYIDLSKNGSKHFKICSPNGNEILVMDTKKLKDILCRILDDKDYIEMMKIVNKDIDDDIELLKEYEIGNIAMSYEDYIKKMIKCYN